MSRSRFLLNLAISLFLAPTPALLLLAWMSGGQGIPFVFGIGAMALSAGLYWAWLISRMRGVGRAAAAAEEEDHDAPAGTGSALVLSERLPDRPAYGAKPGDRNRAHDVRSYEDLPDPMAERLNLSPAEILIDRVSDITQVKKLVERNKVHLLTAWHRQVRDNARGDRSYGDWALEADRLLLSASFMTRTLTRHEAIALVTAEVGAIVAAREAEAQEKANSRTRAAAELPPARYPGDFKQTPQPAAPMRLGPAAAQMPARQIAQMPQQAARPVQMPPQIVAEAGRGGDGVVRILPQVVLRRSTALLECAGWRTHVDPDATAQGIDLIAAREGRMVALRLIAGDDRATPETVAHIAQAATLYGADLAAVVSASGYDRACRATATHAGVVLMEDSDLSDIDTFLPPCRFAGHAGTAAAE